MLHDALGLALVLPQQSSGWLTPSPHDLRAGRGARSPHHRSEVARSIMTMNSMTSSSTPMACWNGATYGCTP